MCDFRSPPKCAEDIQNGNKLDFSFCGIIHSDQAKTVTQPGFYYVAATGSAYYLYDGRDWWCNRDDWGTPSKEGIPLRWNKYRFIFDPNEPELHLLSDRKDFCEAPTRTP